MSLPPDFKTRFWQNDPTLWGGDQTRLDFIAQFLGWIHAPNVTLSQLPQIQAFADQIIAEGFTNAVVLGMGGSSLSSLMLAETVATGSALRLSVLDSTVPAEVLRCQNHDPQTTLYIVASKSGSTIEPLAFEEYIYDQLVQKVGTERANASMVAITDPGSEMEARARQRGYRKIFLGEPTVGGRFSLFTPFGMVPAALAGIDIASMLNAVAVSIGDQNHPGFVLGEWLADCTLAGQDKITFITKKIDQSIGLWAEQLIAESTGKNGVGILPLATEPAGQPDSYGPDRAFIVITNQADRAQLESQIPPGYPSRTLIYDSPAELAQILYQFEIATATAGAILDVNPFDQPNVQAAKEIAKRELAKIQATGNLPEHEFETNSGILQLQGAKAETVGQAVSNFLQNANPADVATILAFIPEQDTIEPIQAIRTAIRDRLKLATAFGYGPRYLHSTGQYHKGGPNNGLYIVITANDAIDPAIPGMNATFGQLKTAQALGDIGALRENNRRVVHLHINSNDAPNGLAQLKTELGIP